MVFCAACVGLLASFSKAFQKPSDEDPAIMDPEIKDEWRHICISAAGRQRAPRVVPSVRMPRDGFQPRMGLEGRIECGGRSPVQQKLDNATTTWVVSKAVAREVHFRPRWFRGVAESTQAADAGALYQTQRSKLLSL